MAKGTAKPGSVVTRKVSQGPNKGDTVTFTANSSSAELPGKLVPRAVRRDVGGNNTTDLPHLSPKKRFQRSADDDREDRLRRMNKRR